MQVGDRGIIFLSAYNICVNTFDQDSTDLIWAVYQTRCCQSGQYALCCSLIW